MHGCLIKRNEDGTFRITGGASGQFTMGSIAKEAQELILRWLDGQPMYKQKIGNTLVGKFIDLGDEEKNPHEQAAERVLGEMG